MKARFFERKFFLKMGKIAAKPKVLWMCMKSLIPEIFVKMANQITGFLNKLYI